MVTEPNVKDKTIDQKMSHELVEFLTELREKVDNDDRSREQWKNKMITASNQRMGLKRYMAKPYPGAPNIPLPETDKLIKKAVPNYVLSSWSVKKLCRVQVEGGVQVTPELEEKAKRAEAAMNLILRDKMDLFRKEMSAADYLKQYGFCLFRVTEQFKSRLIRKVIDLDDYGQDILQQLRSASNAELRQFIAERFEFDLEDEDDKAVVKDVLNQFRSGETVLEFDKEEISSLPDIEIPLPTKVIVPPYTTDINKANRITYEYFMTKEELELKSEQGIFRKKVIDKLNELEKSGVAAGDDDIVEEQKEQNEGVFDSQGKGELYRIHETCCWYKKKEGDRSRKWVFTFLADVTSPNDALLQDIPFPYEFEGWVYEKCNNEDRDPRYHSSRGVPEQIRAIQNMMERSVNNLLIRDEMNNNPMWEILSSSGLMDSHVYFRPGQKLPVKALGTEIRKLNDPITVDISSERIMQVLKAYAEEYLGNTDQLFRNATNKGGGKTLGEVNQGMQAVSGPINMEVLSWFATLQKLYTMVFKLMRERLGDSIFIEGMEITKEDFNFEADVIPNGSIDLANESVRIGKAMARLQLSLQLPPTIILPEDQYNAARDYFEADGVRDPDKYITRPEEVAKMMREQAMAEDAVLQKEEAGIAKEISNLREQGGVMAEGGNGEQR